MQIGEEAAIGSSELPLESGNNASLMAEAGDASVMGAAVEESPREKLKKDSWTQVDGAKSNTIIWLSDST